jgi:hypothetical protein
VENELITTILQTALTHGHTDLSSRHLDCFPPQCKAEHLAHISETTFLKGQTETY